MIKEREFRVLSHLRYNARKPLTKVAEEEGIPVTTVHDYYRKLRKTVITKEVAMVDFSKLGCQFRYFYFFRNRRSLKYLKEERCVNNVYLLGEGAVLAEVVIKIPEEKEEFLERMNANGLEPDEHIILDDVAREKFFPARPPGDGQ